MKLIKVASMFKEKTQDDREWKIVFHDLKNRIDKALEEGDHQTADKLEMKLEAFLENAESYLSEVEEGRSNEDMEPDEHGAGRGSGGQTGGVHYLEEVPQLYEEYLMAKDGRFVEKRLGRGFEGEGSLEDELAYYTFLMLSSSHAGSVDHFIKPEDFLISDGKYYTNQVKPEKKQLLIDIAKEIWEKRVALIRKSNPDWEGYWGYFE